MSHDAAVPRVLDGRVWEDFCEGLKRVGRVVMAEGCPATPLDRAEGYRYLTRLLRAGLESRLEYGDPRFPGFYQLSNETIKIGNDNPDNLYQNCTISGRYAYRITGTRGTVPYLSLGTKAGGYGSTGRMEPTGQLDAEDLQVGPRGELEIQVACEPRPGNWLPMTPESSMLIVRQTFADRRREEPARLRIERLGERVEARLTPDELAAGLQGALAFVQGTAELFVSWMEGYAAHTNQLPADDQEKCQRAGGDARIHYFQSRWRLAADEALLVEAPVIPECEGWNFQLSNFWMESLDYRHHRIHVNQHTATYEADGSVRIVVAHRDPGPSWPNWLETVGHREGGMLFRWIGARSHPPVHTRVVSFEELESLASG